MGSDFLGSARASAALVVALIGACVVAGGAGTITIRIDSGVEFVQQAGFVWAAGIVVASAGTAIVVVLTAGGVVASVVVTAGSV